MRQRVPEVLYRGQPTLLLLPFMIFLGRVVTGFHRWYTILMTVTVLPLMLLGQLLFWLLSWRAARRAGQRRLGPSWVPFTVYLLAALSWPLAVPEDNDQQEFPSVLTLVTGMDLSSSWVVAEAGLMIMAAAGAVALIMALVPPNCSTSAPLPSPPPGGG